MADKTLITNPLLTTAYIRTGSPLMLRSRVQICTVLCVSIFADRHIRQLCRHYCAPPLRTNSDCLDDNTKRGSITTLGDETGKIPDFRSGSTSEVGHGVSDVR